MSGINRIEALDSPSATVVGIDFVYVDANQLDLYVFFYPTQIALTDAATPVAASQISIVSPSGGESLPTVPLDPAFTPTWMAAPSWMTTEVRTILHIKTSEPGDFSRYKLRIDDSATFKLDPYYREAGFSFKANCPSNLDCEPPAHECPPDDFVDYPVNYQARDFWSIRQALLDFASARHPEWQDRLEADFGMMLAEVMSAIGDEFAYYQDRISREGYFETATQRRSVRRLARLVDYEMSDGLGGKTWLDFQVTGSPSVDAGTQVWVKPESVPPGVSPASVSSSVYEVGLGLMQGRNASTDGSFAPLGAVVSFQLDSQVNNLTAYQWDASETCLPVGSTCLDVVDDLGSLGAKLKSLFDLTDSESNGKWIVLKTNPNDGSIPIRTQLVHLIDAVDDTDPLTNTAITHLTWESAQATEYEMEFASLVVLGNIVPATAGKTLEAYFQVDAESSASALPSAPALPFNPVQSQNIYYNGNFSGFAIERQAPGTAELVADNQVTPFDPSFLFSLPGSEVRDLAWQGPDTSTSSPEVRILPGQLVAGKWSSGNEWNWKRSLLGVNSSLPTDTDFTLDDGTWRIVAGYRRVDETGAVQQFVHYDYASGSGTTIRFGNGEFGEAPARGQLFRAVYRLGNGLNDNVAADSLTGFDSTLLPDVISVTNSFDVLNALPPETLDNARHVAPEAFRAVRYNAVIEEDYADAVEELDWVQKAGAAFRWTGSWLTLFATPDPVDSYTISPAQSIDLEQQLDRYRLAGREAYGMDPVYANLVLDICVCVAPTSYIGDVEAAVMEALFGTSGVNAKLGFFSPDNWTFGMPLDRASLEAAIQAVPGVRAVEEIYIERRGWFETRLFNELVYTVAANEIVRVDNDPNFPERGALKLSMEGGA